MPGTIDNILLQDSWSEKDLELLKDACLSDGDLLDDVRRRRTLQNGIRGSIHAATSDAEALVLHALSTSTQADHLTGEELNRAREWGDGLDATLSRHPAVSTILKQIRVDAAVFEEAWDASSVEVTHNAAERGKTRLIDRLPKRRISRLRPVVRWSAGIAAGLIIVVTFSILSRVNETVSNVNSIQTAPGELRLVNLDDGTEVRLLGDSHLEYATTEDGFERSVRLTGNAFFDVEPDAVSFRVETANAVTTVHGTSFGVSARKGVTEVTLVTGKVSLSSASDGSLTVLLNPGQMSRISANGAPSSPEVVSLSEALSWTGLFIFRNTPLPEITGTLSRELHVRILLSAELETETLTGTFSREQAADDILNVIAAALGARLDFEESTSTYSLLL
jgi:transmembrane sensor